MANVSKENLMKVERFFVESVKKIGDKRVEATIQEIADNSNTALATAHKAVKELSQRGVIDIIKGASRRFPITYVYNGDIENFEANLGKDDQIAYMKVVIQDQETYIRDLEEKVRRLENMQKNSLK